MARTMKLWAPLVVLASLATLVTADVKFKSPKAGDTLTGGTTLEVEWEESNDKPLISDLTTYQLFLCAGGNDAASIVSLYPKLDDLRPKS